MRRVAVWVACVVVGLAISGCGNFDDGSFDSRNGVGAKLHWANMAEETTLLDQYISYVCQQADLPALRRGDPGPNCKPSGADWALFVQAGMNDIDRRCDAFLSWVDYIRRSREHWLNQLIDTLTATTQIMGATGASPKSMQIVTAAFGLGKNTLINSTERLLTLAENSTVQSVVLGEQKKFRAEFLKYARQIDNQPAAIYTLRSYLRICMPMTIEQQINSTVTIYQQSGTVGLGRRNDDPLITPMTVAPPPKAREGLLPPAPTHQAIPGWVTNEEKNMGPTEFKMIQRMLCSEADGKFGPKTRAGIRIFQQQTLPPNSPTTGQIDMTLRQSLVKEVGKLGDCQRDSGLKHRNYYERTLFSDPREISKLQMRLNFGGVGDSIATTGVFDSKTRAKIAAFRSANATKIKEINAIIGEVRDQITPAIDVVIPEIPAPSQPSGGQQ